MSHDEFLPITRPFIDEQTIAEVGDVLRSGWITTGPRCRELELALARRLGGRPVRLLSSATAALELALRLCDISPGDEVVTTPLSWVATANVILAVGARPVFVDVDTSTRNIDLDKVDAAITERTRALMPVDLAGLPVDRDRLYRIARRRELRVVEDAAQSFGSTWRGKAIGSFGDLVSFSFHATKNLTTAEGGCLVLNTEAEARRLELLRLQGVERFSDGSMDAAAWGAKANLTDIAATLGLGQLRTVDANTFRRRAIAERYFERWDAGLGFELPARAAAADGNWHLFQPLLPRRLASRRGEFIAAMREQGIAVGVHYPAMHLFTLFRRLGYRPGDFPVAEDIGMRTVTLPLFPEMSDRDVERVCNAVAASVAAME